jgi:hypothetical protein
MSIPSAPVLLKEAKCDKTGVLVSWIAPSNAKIDNFTVSWKAESWWQSAQAVVHHQMTEFLISEIPPNEKISVWVFATNELGSSTWSDRADFVSSRDCGQTSTAPDILSEEVDVSADDIFKVAYTKDFDQYFASIGLVSSVEVLSYEDSGTEVKKLARVTPPIPASIRSLAQSYLGDTIVTYDEVSIKSFATREITFKIENIPVVGQYVEVASGKLCFIDVGPNRCRLEGYFDLRINYPVLGYYVAQVIRSQVIKDMTEWPKIAAEYVKKQKASA